MSETKDRTIIQADWFNGLYEGDTLKESAKPEYLDAETLARIYPDAAVFFVPQDVYDEFFDGGGFPDKLSLIPLERCARIR